LTNFRAIKSSWLEQFDANTAGSLGDRLESIRTAGTDYISSHPNRPELNAKIRDAVTKIATLLDAVDAIRPNNATRYDTVGAIDHGIGALQDTCTGARDGSYPYCVGAGNGALEKLDAALQGDTTTGDDAVPADFKALVHGIDLAPTSDGLDRIRNIMICRFNDEQIRVDRAKLASAECQTPAASATAPTYDLNTVLRAMIPGYDTLRRLAGRMISDRPAPATPTDTGASAPAAAPPASAGTAQPVSPPAPTQDLDAGTPPADVPHDAGVAPLPGGLPEGT
jgi:hypothetical protein